MRVEEALSQVRLLRSQVARAGEFCCYRSATIAISGISALVAAIAQSYWIPQPVAEPHRYLLLWIVVAALSVSITGVEIAIRWLWTDSSHARRQTILTVRQFVPCLVVGASLTWVLATFCREHIALLPGLWAVVFSLGVFASSVHLPTGAMLVAVYYLVAGLVCLRWGQGPQALAPWTMMITFGAGQMMTAIVLYRREERNDGQQ
jgi:hypothetical protein